MMRRISFFLAPCPVRVRAPPNPCRAVDLLGTAERVGAGEAFVE